MKLLEKGLISKEINISAVKRSTFTDAFSRFSPNLFRDVFSYLLSKLTLNHIPELAVFGTLYCIDGSLFPVISSMLWAEYKTGHNALKLHLCFELNRMIAVDFIIGTGKSNEREALRLMLVSSVTYIADRGYLSFQIFHDILKKQSNFVFRVKSNLVYNVVGSMTIQIPAHIAHLFQAVRDELILCDNDPYSIVYRLVNFQIGKEQYFILTSRVDLTTFQIILLYAYRWQIELIFRFLKRTMNGIHLVRQDQTGSTIQFYALLITALLELNLKQQVVSKTEKEQKLMNKTENDLQIINMKEKDSHAQASILNDVEVFLSKDKQVENEHLEDGSTQTFSSNGVDDFFKEVFDTNHFFEVIGSQLKKYWKIGIYWLTELRILLSGPFDDRAIRILGSA